MQVSSFKNQSEEQSREKNLSNIKSSIPKKERERAENILEEIVAKSLLYLLKKKKPNLQPGEAWQTSSRINANKTTSRHIKPLKKRKS